MNPRVRTQYGDVEGFVDGGVLHFFGLPFAAPPVGGLRWRAPQLPERWDGVRPAIEFGPACPQFVPAMFDIRTDARSEDCLYLNVWTTTVDAEARQPVMVWIHGGGYLYGAASEDGFDGARLATRGVTVVTVGYRLGVFGLASHPDIGSNFAILDHIAALVWVRDNIATFGGDPDCVTVFGQSAGAVSVRSLLAATKARGLFHRAIMQSGGGEPMASADPAAPPKALRATAEIFERLGGPDPDRLRRAPTEQVAVLSQEFSGAVPPPGQVHTPANLVWTPVLDGEVLSATGFPGAANDLPIMIGCTENEARYFIKPGTPFPDVVVEAMTRALTGSAADEALVALGSLGLPTFESLDHIFTAAVFVEPALAAVKRWALEGRPVYYYSFDRVSPGGERSGERAKHTADIRYVFGNLDPVSDFNDVDRQVSDKVMAAWVSFARTGIPESVSAWPRFAPDDPRQTVIADVIEERPLADQQLVEIISSLR